MTQQHDQIACPGWGRLRGYQQRGALRLAAGDVVGLWYGAGLGKTATALTAFRAQPALPVLILTRALGRHVWGRDAAWALGDAYPVAVLWGGKRYAKEGRHRDGTFSDLDAALEAAQIVVTNYEVVGKRAEALQAVPWQYLILDESHAIKQGWQPPKRYASNRWRIKKRRFEHVQDLARLVQARGGRVWGLTATPIPDRVRDLWAQLKVLLPAETQRFYPPWSQREEPASWPSSCWAGRYCDLKRGYNDSYDCTGASSTGELKAYLESRFAIETRRSVASELPVLSRDVRTVSPVVDREHMGGGLEPALARAAKAKAPLAVDLALEYLTSADKVVLVTNRRRLCGELAVRLEAACRRSLPAARKRRLWLSSVTGETEIRARVGETQQFQEHRGPAALVATIDSVTEAIDLHHASGAICVALPYTPRQLEQFEGRFSRVGGVPCTVHYLVAEDTVDERVRQVILDKLATVTEAGAETQGAEGAYEALRKMRDEEAVLTELRAWLEESAG